MWQQFVGVLALVMAGVLVVLRFRAQSRGMRNEIDFFRPLPTLLMVMIAFLVPTPVSTFYKGAILLGLAVSFVADLLLMIAGTPQIVGAGTSLLVYFLYFVAFASQTAPQIPTPWLLLPLVYGGWLFYYLFPKLQELKLTVAIYMVVVVLMCWQALQVWVQSGEMWSLLALVGVLFFIIADSVRGIEAFRRPRAHNEIVTMSAYYLAHALIALSVWGSLLTRWSLPV